VLWVLRPSFETLRGSSDPEREAHPPGAGNPTSSAKIYNGKRMRIPKKAKRPNGRQDC